MLPTSAPPVSLTPLFTGFTSANLEIVLAVIITIVFIWWAIFTVVGVYHWMRYARDTVVAVPILVLHFVVSGWVFIFATGGLH